MNPECTGSQVPSIHTFLGAGGGFGWLPKPLFSQIIVCTCGLEVKRMLRIADVHHSAIRRVFRLQFRCSMLCEVGPITDSTSTGSILQII